MISAPPSGSKAHEIGGSGSISSDKGLPPRPATAFTIAGKVTATTTDTVSHPTTDDEGLSEGSRSPSSSSLGSLTTTASGSTSASTTPPDSPTRLQQHNQHEEKHSCAAVKGEAVDEKEQLIAMNKKVQEYRKPISRAEKMMMMSQQDQQCHEKIKENEEDAEDDEELVHASNLLVSSASGSLATNGESTTNNSGNSFTSESLASIIQAAAQTLPLPVPVSHKPNSTVTSPSTSLLVQGIQEQEGRLLTKKEIRMLKNRESAARSRKRKRDMMENLEESVKHLSQQNTLLKAKLDIYVSRYGPLEDIIMESRRTAVL